MKPNNSRNSDIIEHILRYCLEMDQTVERFGGDKETFMADAVYRNSVAMPVQQIGELAKHLIDEFLEKYT